LFYADVNFERERGNQNNMAVVEESVISHFVLLITFRFLLTYDVVDCIYIRNSSATSTCGNPPEQYFENWQGVFSLLFFIFSF